MAVIPRNAQGHGWLRPAIGVVELSQCIIQVMNLSSMLSLICYDVVFSISPIAPFHMFDFKQLLFCVKIKLQTVSLYKILGSSICFIVDLLFICDFVDLYLMLIYACY